MDVDSLISLILAYGVDKYAAGALDTLGDRESANRSREAALDGLTAILTEIRAQYRARGEDT